MGRNTNRVEWEGTLTEEERAGTITEEKGKEH
jgi:hypothetical protein